MAFGECHVLSSNAMGAKSPSTRDTRRMYRASTLRLFCSGSTVLSSSGPRESVALSADVLWVSPNWRASLIAVVPSSCVRACGRTQGPINHLGATFRSVPVAAHHCRSRGGAVPWGVWEVLGAHRIGCVTHPARPEKGNLRDMPCCSFLLSLTFLKTAIAKGKRCGLPCIGAWAGSGQPSLDQRPATRLPLPAVFGDQCRLQMG